MADARRSEQAAVSPLEASLGQDVEYGLVQELAVAVGQATHMVVVRTSSAYPQMPLAE